MQQQKKKDIAKGAIVGGILGAYIGVPVLGAALGAGYKYTEDEKNVKRKRTR